MKQLVPADQDKEIYKKNPKIFQTSPSESLRCQNKPQPQMAHQTNQTPTQIKRSWSYFHINFSQDLIAATQDTQSRAEQPTSIVQASPGFSYPAI